MEVIIILLLIIVSVIAVVKLNGNKKQKTKQYLKENGSIITAKYLTVVTEETLDSNKIKPYKIICIGMDPETGKEITFKSEELMNNPIKYITDNNITTFNVHINLKNIKQYYVDVEELKKHLR